MPEAEQNRIKFMNEQTEKLLEMTLRSDKTITPAARSRILKLITRNGEAEPVQNGNGHTPKIYSREQAAQLLGDKTERYIDQLCKRGLLHKFIPPGNVRAIGVTANSLNQFLGIGA